jgi:GH15 family glucan-1,4-alpha-glucosidase
VRSGARQPTVGRAAVRDRERSLMPAIEDYALLGDTRTAALVSRTGSIDWLCMPRFDSGACFAALLGTPENGRWRLAPAAAGATARRHYVPGTMVLETEWETPEGAVSVVDCMPIPGGERIDVVRLVRGRRGRVRCTMDLVVRFDYGHVVPWVRRVGEALVALAGPDALELRTPVAHHGEDLHTVADFTVDAGQSVPFVLSWHPSYVEPPAPIDVEDAVRETVGWWQRWSSRCSYDGEWAEAVQRSLLTLKALTFGPTGGIVAAPTTSLPEDPGGVRNWDYRFCWLRDATFTLYALLVTGYRDEARAWREWLLRAAAGDAHDIRVLYGLAGERRLPELELPWLPGFADSRPVRVGNAASAQLQLDVYGEVMDFLHVARRAGVEPDPFSWDMQKVLLDTLESRWEEPDEGIWEVRGPRRHFTYSKVMAWVAFDRAVKAVQRFEHCEGPLARWQRLRDAIHAEVCARGWSDRRHAFVQSYGDDALDASLLLMPLVGFLPAHDPRVRATVAAITDDLVVDGFVRRYRTTRDVDGLPGGEGVFLACTFWLADNLTLQGRTAEARALFERLLAIRNDVGLLAEEYEPHARRQLGNFPQALSHIALVNTAHNLTRAAGPARERAER